MVDCDLGVTWAKLTYLRVGVGRYETESAPWVWSGIHICAEGGGDKHPVMWTDHKVDK